MKLAHIVITTKMWDPKIHILPKSLFCSIEMVIERSAFVTLEETQVKPEGESS
jgi:hypothetical protein